MRKKEATATINKNALNIVRKARKKTHRDIAEKLGVTVRHYYHCLRTGEILEDYLSQIAEYLDVHPDLLQGDFILKNDLTDKGIDLEKDLFFLYDYKSYQSETFDFYELINTLIYLTTGYEITGQKPVFTKQQYEEIITNMLDSLFVTIRTFKKEHPKFNIPFQFYNHDYMFFDKFVKNADYFREPTIEELEEQLTEIKELKEQLTKIKEMVISASQKGIDISTVERVFKKLENNIKHLEQTEKNLKKTKNIPLTKRKRDI